VGQRAADSGFRVMACDVPADPPWNQGENAFFVSLRSETAEEVTAYREKLFGRCGRWPRAVGAPVRNAEGITWVVDVVSEYEAS
jgi:PhnB protein